MTQVAAEITNGDTPLQRLYSVNIASKEFDRKLNQLLLNEARKYKLPGFRKTSKVVPPAFKRAHEQRLTTYLLNQMAEPQFAEKVKTDKLNILPSIIIKDHKRHGDLLEVIYQFEIKPEVPTPDVKGKKFLKPVPKLEKKEYDQVIERMRFQHADWKVVDRAAKQGDRITYRLAASNEEKEVDLMDQLPEDMLNQLVGAKVGQEIEINIAKPDQDALPLKIEVTAVKEAKLPELDVAFANKIIPDSKSVEEFVTQISKQIDVQAKRIARSVLSSRVLLLLELGTPSFDLPFQHISVLAQKRQQELVANAQKQGQNVTPDHVNMERLTASVTGEMRTSLILANFVDLHELKATEEQISEFIETEAKDHENPDDFIAFAKQDKETIKGVHREVLQDRVNEKILELSEAEDNFMNFDQLNLAHQGDDPVLLAGQKQLAEMHKKENGEEANTEPSESKQNDKKE